MILRAKEFHHFTIKIISNETFEWSLIQRELGV